MKTLPLCLCLFMGCAGTTPQDVLNEMARAADALLLAYHAECDGRETNAGCADALGAYNGVIEHLTQLNEKVPEK